LRPEARGAGQAQDASQLLHPSALFHGAGGRISAVFLPARSNVISEISKIIRLFCLKPRKPPDTFIVA
jgi:hypothetical protein